MTEDVLPSDEYKVYPKKCQYLVEVGEMLIQAIENSNNLYDFFDSESTILNNEKEYRQSFDLITENKTYTFMQPMYTFLSLENSLDFIASNICRISTLHNYFSSENLSNDDLIKKHQQTRSNIYNSHAAYLPLNCILFINVSKTYVEGYFGKYDDEYIDKIDHTLYDLLKQFDTENTLDKETYDNFILKINRMNTVYTTAWINVLCEANPNFVYPKVEGINMMNPNEYLEYLDDIEAQIADYLYGENFKEFIDILNGCCIILNILQSIAYYPDEIMSYGTVFDES